MFVLYHAAGVVDNRVVYGRVSAVPNKPFKVHERNCAKLIDGWRYPANMGGPVDAESEHAIVQAKLVQEMSLSALTAHVLAIEAEGRRRKKKAMVMIKLRAGKGVTTPTLVCMTDTMFREMFPSFLEIMREVSTCPETPAPPPTNARAVVTARAKETPT